MKFNKIGSFFLDVTSTVEFTVNVGAAGLSRLTMVVTIYIGRCKKNNHQYVSAFNETAEYLLT